MTDTFTWGCEKWADCSCCDSQEKCGCGAGCGCGTVSVEDVKKAIDTQCEKVDCRCGMACRCGKGSCHCGGSQVKNQQQWVEYTKNLNEGTPGTCNCEKDAEGKCSCSPTCRCAAGPSA